MNLTTLRTQAYPLIKALVELESQSGVEHNGECKAKYLELYNTLKGLYESEEKTTQIDVEKIVLDVLDLRLKAKLRSSCTKFMIPGDYDKESLFALEAHNTWVVAKLLGTESYQKFLALWGMLEVVNLDYYEDLSYYCFLNSDNLEGLWVAFPKYIEKERCTVFSLRKFGSFINVK